MKSLGIYIHIPFCKSKCNYCDFYSLVSNEEYITDYVNRIEEEILSFGEKLASNYIIDTIFIGGGTPSILPIESIDKIINAINRSFRWGNSVEISIECNPNTISKEKLIGYRNLSINRISLGVQTLSDNFLRTLGRKGNRDNSINAIKLVSSIFDNFSIDLMLGIPNQTKNIVLDDLQEILTYEPKHISAYTLQVENDTPLFNNVECGKIQLLSDDITVDIYNEVYETLTTYGYNRYEVSNFAKESFECKHNQRYWSMKDYLGIGVSAHSLIEKVRFYNKNDLNAYLEGKKISVLEEKLTQSEFEKEYIMLALRTAYGIDLKMMDDFITRDDILDRIYNNKQYFNIDTMHICLKPSYFEVMNSIINLIL